MLAQFTNIKPFDKFEVKRSLLDNLGDKLNLLDVHKHSAHSVTNIKTLICLRSSKVSRTISVITVFTIPKGDGKGEIIGRRSLAIPNSQI